jgi:DNA-binding NtrC family response regulator
MDHQEIHVLDAPVTGDFVYGVSPTIQTINDMAAEIAGTDISILIVGESGSGKDAYARLIHRRSLKNNLRLQKINCATCDPNQLTVQMHESSRDASDGEAYGTVYFDNVQEFDIPVRRCSTGPE